MELPNILGGFSVATPHFCDEVYKVDFTLLGKAGFFCLHPSQIAGQVYPVSIAGFLVALLPAKGCLGIAPASVAESHTVSVILDSVMWLCLVAQNASPFYTHMIFY
jgi:hypothetical protein